MAAKTGGFGNFGGGKKPFRGGAQSLQSAGQSYNQMGASSVAAGGGGPSNPLLAPPRKDPGTSRATTNPKVGSSNIDGRLGTTQPGPKHDGKSSYDFFKNNQGSDTAGQSWQDFLKQSGGAPGDMVDQWDKDGLLNDEMSQWWSDQGNTGGMSGRDQMRYKDSIRGEVEGWNQWRAPKNDNGGGGNWNPVPGGGGSVGPPVFGPGPSNNPPGTLPGPNTELGDPGDIGTSVENYDVYTDQMTGEAVNRARQDAHASSYMPELLAQGQRQGVRSDASLSNVANAYNKKGRGQIAAQMAGVEIPFQHQLANAQSNLIGEKGRADEFAGLFNAFSKLQQGKRDANYSQYVGGLGIGSAALDSAFR
jgi:hypothetical protein